MEDYNKIDATEKEMKDVPFYAYEYTMARFERTIKRLVTALIISIVLMFLTNAIWVYEWNQYDYTDVTVDSNDGGNANYIGVSGVINNGEGNSKEAGKKEPQ